LRENGAATSLDPACYLLYDLCESARDMNDRRLSIFNIPRIGSIWVDVVIEDQIEINISDTPPGRAL
jgi:hypothetical protein